MQRPRRNTRAPIPVYVPDPNTRFIDDDDNAMDISDDENSDSIICSDGESCDDIDDDDNEPNEYVPDDFLVTDDTPIEYEANEAEEDSYVDSDDDSSDESDDTEDDSDSENNSENNSEDSNFTGSSIEEEEKSSTYEDEMKSE